MRKIIGKVIISISLVFVTICFIDFWKNKTKTNADYSGIITVTIKDLGGTELTKKIEFTEEDTLLGLLEQEFTIRYEISKYGAVIYDIEWIKTDFKSTYIAIYIDGLYGTEGISYIVLKDNMTILLEETRL